MFKVQVRYPNIQTLAFIPEVYFFQRRSATDLARSCSITEHWKDMYLIHTKELFGVEAARRQNLQQSLERLCHRAVTFPERRFAPPLASFLRVFDEKTNVCFWLSLHQNQSRVLIRLGVFFQTYILPACCFSLLFLNPSPVDECMSSLFCGESSSSLSESESESESAFESESESDPEVD